MKIRIKDGNCGRWFVVHLGHGVCGPLGLFAHVQLNVAPLAVDAIQCSGQFVGTASFVGQQAFNAQRHVGQPSRSIDARPEREAKVEGSGYLCLAP